MALSANDVSMALFCDFENIALGVRDAQYEKFDIKPVLERLLLKGSIVVKKAYCDWDRYKSYKAVMHEANFELIEIPHVRQSGKNSADIRMVVDALDLCYTKAHVNTFVIISGDSDFSPLVSKLRENAKRVIGVGVKQSTSDLLIANCDEFIYIDDLVRKRQRDSGSGSDRQNRKPTENVDPQELEARRIKALEMAATTLEAMLEDRADDEKVWASVLKEAIKRRHPGFNETYHGFKTFGAMLEEAAKHGLLEFGRDANSAYVRRRSSAAPAGTPSAATADTPAPATAALNAADAVSPAPTFSPETTPAATEKKSRGRSRSRKPKAAESASSSTAGAISPKTAEPSAASAAEPAAPTVAESAAPTAAAVTTPAAATTPAVSSGTRLSAEKKSAAKPARKPRTARPAASPPLPAPAGAAPTANPATPAARRRPAAAASSRKKKTETTA